MSKSRVTARFTLNLTAKSEEAVNWLSENTGLSRTDVANRALQLYRFIQQVTGEGGELRLVRADGTIQSLKVI